MAGNGDWALRFGESWGRGTVPQVGGVCTDMFPKLTDSLGDG